MSVSNANAERALARLAAHDDTINANDPMQVAAYQALRQTTSRISVIAFTKFLKSQKTDVVQTAKMTTSFWLVPKASLPEPPPGIASAIVDESSLQEQGVPAGPSIDFDAYLVVDKIVPREKLPKGTTEAVFALGAVHKYKGNNLNEAAATGADKWRAVF